MFHGGGTFFFDRPVASERGQSVVRRTVTGSAIFHRRDWFKVSRDSFVISYVNAPRTSHVPDTSIRERN